MLRMLWELHHENYLIQIYKHNCFDISDVQDVENNPLVGMLAILKHNESVFFFNHIILPKQWFVAYKVCLYITVSIILHVLTSAIYEISWHL